MRPLIVITILTALTAGADGADRWQRALDRGEILVHARDGGEVVVKAVINAAPRKVWALVSRCDRYPGTMPRITAARELSRQKGRVVCRVTVDMPFPYSDLTATTRVIHRESTDRFSRRWKLMHGDYKVNRGSWELSPYRGDAGRTLVIYKVRAVPKAWIPDWIRRKAQKASLPKMIRQLRKLSAQRSLRAKS